MKRLILITLGIVLVLNTPVAAQQASQNIPVLPVITEADDDLWYLKGDGYLQRQVEPTGCIGDKFNSQTTSIAVCIKFITSIQISIFSPVLYNKISAY